MTDSITSLPEAVADRGALPMPAGPARLSDDLIADYAAVDFTELMEADAAAVVTRMRDRLTGEIQRQQAELDRHTADSVEYGIRIPDGSVLSATTSLSEQQARLERYRDCWPDAVLVQRLVFHGEWAEAAS